MRRSGSSDALGGLRAWPGCEGTVVDIELGEVCVIDPLAADSCASWRDRMADRGRMGP